MGYILVSSSSGYAPPIPKIVKVIKMSGWWHTKPTLQHNIAGGAKVPSSYQTMVIWVGNLNM